MIDLFGAYSAAINQRPNRPLVYLDHWAIRDFSEDRLLLRRFISALKSKGGDLVVSSLNLTEFSASNVRDNCVAAEAFFDDVFPNIYLSHFDPYTLRAANSGGAFVYCRMNPTQDDELLRTIYGKGIFEQISRGFYGCLADIFRDREAVLANRNFYASRFANSLYDLRNDERFMRKVRSHKPSIFKVEYVQEKLLYPFFARHKANWDVNDSIDYMHLIFSLCSCDFVLIDSRWEAGVKSVLASAKRNGVPLRVANVYSKKGNGVLRFLDDLERFVLLIR
jgi:hypothetical protein